MSKTILGPGGGALPSRPDSKMSAEHPIAIGPWSGGWKEMVKKSATKKRRQRDRREVLFSEQELSQD